MSNNFSKLIVNQICCWRSKQKIKNIYKSDLKMSFIQKKAMLSSWPIRKLINSLPDKSSSAAIGDINGVAMVLTVQHAVGDFGLWAIELEYDINDRQAKLYKLGQMGFVKRFLLKPGLSVDIDFAYKILPESLQSKNQYITPWGEILFSVDRIKCDFETQQNPSQTQKYSFFGQITPHLNGTFLALQRIIVSGMEFDRKENDFYVFKLPYKHPGHDLFKGCSGAPILGEDGKAYAILCKGLYNRNEIYGISIKQMNSVLQAEIDQHNRLIK